MLKADAVTAIRKLNSELFNLELNSVITLVEVDFSDLVFYPNQAPFYGNTIFRFHNNNKAINNNIIWNNQIYYATPIQLEGFEYNSKGTVAAPKMTLYVPDSAAEVFRLFKKQFKSLDNDLVGAKVTRIKTFYKFIDASNFTDETRPVGLDPTPNAELSRDVYYIDKKSYEDKNFLEFELTSFFNLNGVSLPQRLVFANRCPFSYRGEGCLYEYDHPTDARFQRRNSAIHGSASNMPDLAPPVATVNNELIFGVILTNNEIYNDRGSYNINLAYSKGDGVYITKNGLNFYFVARAAVPIGSAPPDINYWIPDECSQDILGCEFRWKILNNSQLPFGGFPGVDRTR